MLANIVHVNTRVVQATGNNIFFTADRDYWVKSIDIVKSADSAATSIGVEVLDDGEAADAGVDLMNPAVQDLGATPDNRTRLAQVLTATLSNRKISAGQHLGTYTTGATNTIVGEVYIRVTLATTSDAANVG